MSIYLKSSDIPGAVTAKGFENTFEIQSISYGITRNIGSRIGTTASDSSVANLSEISLSKQLDVASTKLFAASLDGKILSSMVISFVRQNAAGPETFLEITLGNVIVSSFSTSGVGGATTEAPTETFTLNYGTISVKNTPPKADGSAGTPATTGWNRVQNMKM
jgi:type VI secretion system secreted protein Hcp